MCLSMSIHPFSARIDKVKISVYSFMDLLSTNCLSKLPNYNSRFVSLSTFKLLSFIVYIFSM